MKIRTAWFAFLIVAAGAFSTAGAQDTVLSGLNGAAGDGALTIPYVTAPADNTYVDKSSRDYFKTAPALIDAQASAAAKELYARLRAGYGSRIISGQTSQHFSDLTAIAGKTPVVKSFDMQNYSPHNPWHDDWSSWDDGSVQAAIDWHNSTGGRGIVTFHWHWFSPSSGKLRTSTFYKKNTGFDVSKAVAPGNREYNEVLRDIDVIAAQLKRLSEAGVPVLWRPLHEAGGGWFWWGAKGPGPALKLHSLMYDRLTVHHGLHNLIWIWSTPEASWYPGNSKADMVGYDSYPGAYDYTPQKSMFNELYKLTGGEKMIALTENGPIPDIDKCLQADAKWAYFLSWNKLTVEQNSAQHLRAVFAHPNVVTLEN